MPTALNAMTMPTPAMVYFERGNRVANTRHQRQALAKNDFHQAGQAPSGDEGKREQQERKSEIGQGDRNLLSVLADGRGAVRSCGRLGKLDTTAE